MTLENNEISEISDNQRTLPTVQKMRHVSKNGANEARNNYAKD